MLEMNNVSFSYSRSSDNVLKNINLIVKKGEYISIVGENGSGKSTLLKIILKLISPTSGKLSISFDRTGYVPQKQESFNAQFPLTVYEMLDCHRKIIKIKDVKIIESALDTVGMGSYRNSLIGNLSGGQRQRVFIARALMGSPDLLVLDEPSTGVDAVNQCEIYKTIKNLNIKKGITIITVEHNLKAAILNSSSIFYISHGEGHICSPETFEKLYKSGEEYASI
jgi:zinc transport system ATP-binding protein